MNSGICERLNEPCVIQINLGHLSSRFLRGDANSDGTVNLSDAVFILSYLFQSGSTPSCLDSADVDDNGSVEITDAIYLLAHLFLGGPAPSKPFPGAGQDPTQDSLICLQ